MRNRGLFSGVLLLAAVLAACSQPAAPVARAVASKAAKRVPAVGGALLPAGAPLSGIATSPASLISTHGGGIISSNTAGLVANNAAGLVANNAAGLVANNAGGYRVLQAAGPLYRLKSEEFVPVAKRRVVLLDENRRRVRSVAPVETDEQGRFVFPNVPLSSNWVAEVQLEGFALTSLVRAEASGTVEVTPVTTLVTEYLRTELGQDAAALRVLPKDRFVQLKTDVAQALEQGGVRVDLSSPVRAVRTFDQLAARVPAVAQSARAVVATAREVLVTAQRDGQLNQALTEYDPEPPVAAAPAQDLTALQQQFATYLQSRQLGLPRDIGLGVTVASWNGLPAQWWYGGVDTQGHCAVLMGPSGPKLVRNQFYDVYVSAAQYWTLGAPLSEEQSLDESLTVAGQFHRGPLLKQTFENGVLVHTASSGVMMQLNGGPYRPMAQLVSVGYPPGISAVEVTTYLGAEPGEADGSVSQARFSEPWGLTADPVGVLYVSDTRNGRIRKIAVDRSVTTFKNPRGEPLTLPAVATLVYAGPNTLYAVSESTIVKVQDGRNPEVVAGGGNEAAPLDGPGASVRFRQPRGLALSSNGATLYVADSGNNRLCRVDLKDPNKTVTTLAGTPESGLVDGVGAAARFQHPHGLYLDGSGHLYVADTDNNSIRRVSPAGEVVTLTGTTQKHGRRDGPARGPENEVAMLNRPLAIALTPDGDLYVSEERGHAIRKVALGTAHTYTLAGGSNVGAYQDGAGSQAAFNGPAGILVDKEGALLVADRENHRIRKLVVSADFTRAPQAPAQP